MKTLLYSLSKYVLFPYEGAWFEEGNDWEGTNHILIRIWLMAEYIK